MPLFCKWGKMENEGQRAWWGWNIRMPCNSDVGRINSRRTIPSWILKRNKKWWKLFSHIFGLEKPTTKNVKRMYKQRQGTIQANKTPSSQAFFSSKSKFLYLSSYLLALWYRISLCGTNWPQLFYVLRLAPASQKLKWQVCATTPGEGWCSLTAKPVLRVFSLGFDHLEQAFLWVPGKGMMSTGAKGSRGEGSEGFFFIFFFFWLQQNNRFNYTVFIQICPHLVYCSHPLSSGSFFFFSEKLWLTRLWSPWVLTPYFGIRHVGSVGRGIRLLLRVQKSEKARNKTG